jgi:hypothetical protein
MTSAFSRCGSLQEYLPALAHHHLEDVSYAFTAESRSSAITDPVYIRASLFVEKNPEGISSAGRAHSESDRHARAGNGRAAVAEEVYLETSQVLPKWRRDLAQ